ncbi:MAG: ECF-type sigma factor [Phycisphaerales bacterium]|nr:ECF-type sigma factor [Phycisphaerales bacterium]
MADPAGGPISSSTDPSRDPARDVTRLLREAASGDQSSHAALLSRVYDQLHAIAAARMRSERVDHTLQATALVHEAYARLVGDVRLGQVDRAGFFAVAAQAMQRILVEHARARGRVKRGGGMGEAAARRKIPLDVVDLAAEDDPEQILALDDLVRRLGEYDASAAAVVRLRFYAGLSVEQTAEALGISERTVKREWAFARAWLAGQIEREGLDADGA